MFRRPLRQYLEGKEQAAVAPRELVTAEEFVRRLQQAGQSETEARHQLAIARGLGSAVLVAGVLLSVADES